MTASSACGNRDKGLAPTFGCPRLRSCLRRLFYGAVDHNPNPGTCYPRATSTVICYHRISIVDSSLCDMYTCSLLGWVRPRNPAFKSIHKLMSHLLLSFLEAVSKYHR